MSTSTRLAVALLVASVSCKRYWVCDEPESVPLPTRLSETSLFADIAADRVTDGVVAYRPAYELWSDGATKRRWIFLPPGTEIDKSDPDDWSFPRGTKMWKEFSQNGVRVETRLLEKVDDDAWAAMAYVWSPDGSDAIAAPAGARDARETTHDVPAAGECEACHGGRKSYVLGYSAVQLGQVAVPGDPDDRDALGYLHANCGHCHNQTRPPRDGARCFDPDNPLDFRVLANGDAPAARTAKAMQVVAPGAPSQSRIIDLVSHRGMFKQMPPLATNEVDANGVRLLSGWIQRMPQ